MRILSLYLLKANTGNTRTICEICSGVLIVNFKQVSHTVLVFFTIHFEQRHVGWISSRQYEKIPLREKCAKVFSGLYFPVLGLNMEVYGVNLRLSQSTGKYGPEKAPYWDTFHAVYFHIYTKTLIVYISILIHLQY